MLTLCFETSRMAIEVALMEENRLLASARSEEARGTERHLPRLVQQVMGANGFEALDAIIVCSGPGSFTGLRAGIGFARGLALACSKPSYGITSPAALFASKPSDRHSLIALPARRHPPDKSWWLQAFQNYRPLTPPCEADRETLASELNKADRLISPDLSLKTLAKARNCAFKARIFSVEHMGLAYSQGLADSSPAAPVYARAPDARPGQYDVVGQDRPPYSAHGLDRPG